MRATPCGWRSRAITAPARPSSPPGAKLSPLQVDDAGWNLDPPPATPRLIFVTPSCHHPLGMTMPMEQRLELLHLAESLERLDHRGRFRRRIPLPGPAHPGPARHRARRTAWSMSGPSPRSCFRRMRLGFMVVPEPIRDRIVSAPQRHRPVRAAADAGGTCRLHERGALHPPSAPHAHGSTRKGGPYFLERRRKISRRMAAFPRHRIRHPARRRFSGRTATMRQSPGRRSRQGINVSPLSIQYRHGKAQRGLAMGFAAMDAAATERGMIKLRGVLQQAQPYVTQVTAARRAPAALRWLHAPAAGRRRCR